MPDLTPEKRLAIKNFWQRVNKSAPGGCWLWTGALRSDGYGQYSSRGAHRYAYALVVGPIPVGLELDHLCCVRSCVNPEHLEPVTRDENMRRRSLRRTHCKRGHELTPENTYLYKNSRVCRPCLYMRSRKYRARLKGAA